MRDWVRAGTSPTWSEFTGLSPEPLSWRLQFGNLYQDSAGRLWRRRASPATSLQLVVPLGERRGFIQRYHDSAGCWIVFIGQDCVRMSDPTCSCFVCLTRKSPCPHLSSMGHVPVDHRWDRVAMDILDISVTTESGNLAIVDCLSRWTE